MKNRSQPDPESPSATRNLKPQPAAQGPLQPIRLARIDPLLGLGNAPTVQLTKLPILSTPPTSAIIKGPQPTRLMSRDAPALPPGPANPWLSQVVDKRSAPALPQCIPPTRSTFRAWLPALLLLLLLIGCGLLGALCSALL